MEWNAETIDRLGLILGFISFWLAAPEILGESRLMLLEKWFERTVPLLWLFALLVYFIFGLYQLWISPDTTLDYSDVAPSGFSINFILDATPSTVFAIGIALILGFFLKSLQGKFARFIMLFQGVGTTALVLAYFVLLIGALLTSQNPRLDLVISLWNRAKIPLMFTVVTIGSIILVPRMLDWMADDSSARQRFLWIGAILFVFSFILQYIATLY